MNTGVAATGTSGDDLERLANLIIQMGGLAESQVASALQAVVRRDGDLAMQTVRGDARLDEAEQDIAGEAVRILALARADAGEITQIVTATKIAKDLEEIGNCASAISERAVAIAQVPAVKPAGAIPRLGRLVQEVLKDVLDAYAEGSMDGAADGLRKSAELEDLYNSLFREVLTYMLEDPRTITPCTHLLFIAQNVHAMGRLATAMAGTMQAAERLKQDNAAGPGRLADGV